MKRALLLAAFAVTNAAAFAQGTTTAPAARTRAATAPALDAAQRARLTRSIAELQRDIAAAPAAAATEVAQPAASAVPDAAAGTAVTGAGPQPRFDRQLSRLEPGKVYVVEPSPQKEETFRALVEPQVRTVAGSAPLATVSGIYRVTAKNGSEVQFKPYGYFGDRLAWQQETGRYRGSIFVGILALDPGAAEGGLSKAMVFQALGSEVAPDQVEVNNVGPPFHPMTVEVPAVNEAVTVRVLAKDTDILTIEVPVAPMIRVEATNGEMQGYGLGTMTVHVTSAGIAKPEGRTVSFRASPRGTFTPDKVMLDAQGNGSTTLRSDGVGVVQVSASSGDAIAIPASVNFKIPLETISASLLGGLLGGLIRLLSKRRTSGASKSVIHLLVSVFIGLLGFALYAIGVNLAPAIQPTVTQGAIVVFAMSGVFAYLGVKILGGLSAARA